MNSDSIPEEAKRLTFNIIDELTYGIVKNRHERLSKWEALTVRYVVANSLLYLSYKHSLLISLCLTYSIFFKRCPRLFARKKKSII